MGFFGGCLERKMAETNARKPDDWNELNRNPHYGVCSVWPMIDWLEDGSRQKRGETWGWYKD